MKERSLADLVRRYLIFLAGLFVASMGVAFSTIAGLGTSPVASVPYAVSLVSPLLSLGVGIVIKALNRLFDRFAGRTKPGQ